MTLSPKQKKLCIIAFIVLSTAIGLAAIAGISLNIVSRIALKTFTKQLPSAKMIPYKIDFKRARYCSLTCVEWQEVQALLLIKEGGTFIGDKIVQVNAPKIYLKADNFKERQIHLILKDAEVLLLDSGSKQPEGKLDVQEAEFFIPYDIFSSQKLLSQVSNLTREFERFISDGETKIRSNILAVSHFKLNQKWVKARLSVEPNEGVYALRMNREDIRHISDNLSEKLGEAETALLSKNPLKAEQLLRIRDKALEDSKMKAAGFQGFPEDAYRHILWSFLLTLEFGEMFAKEVTDAHEFGSENTEEERGRDLDNNALGRSYALQGISANDIAETVISDLGSIQPLSHILGFEEAQSEGQEGLKSISDSKKIELIENDISYFATQEGRVESRI